MFLEKIFENDSFIIYEDTKGFDFSYDIENKHDEQITILLTDYDEKITVNNWLGLFNDEKYIINEILKNNYEVLKYEK